MTKKNVAKNTATKTETAVKQEAVNPEAVKQETTTPNVPFPVFPTKLRAKVEEFCNEFNTIQLLKKRNMTTTNDMRKLLLGQEINVRKKLLGVFQAQVVFLLDHAIEQVNKELD